jgi:type I restriction enzyme, S subunit
MGSEWQNYKLGDLGSFRNGANFSKKDYGPGFPIVNVKQLYAYRYVETDNLLEVSSKAISNPESLFLQNGDILFARSSVKGSGAGQAAMIFSCPEHTIFSGFIIRFRTEAKDIALPLFINYLLRSDIYRELLPRIASGTTITNLSQGTLASLPIPLPSLPEQRAIAHILGSLDDKIELNRQMNQTLEATARAIFKSWFVDFDPVRAKAEGRPTGLPDDIAALFPDSFEDSEIGKIPKGWGVRKLGNVANVNWGDTSVTKKSYVKEGFLAYSAKGPDGFLPYYDYDRTGVVVSAIGANSGHTWLAQGKWSCIKNTIRFWNLDDSLSTEYLFHATSGKHHWSLRGSAQPFVSQGDARNIKILCPSNNLAKVFGNYVRPFYKKTVENNDESNTLTSLRDTLLPKLISGEIRVPDAEKLVEEAV